jgi:hypothetical protein
MRSWRRLAEREKASDCFARLVEGVPEGIAILDEALAIADEYVS